MRVFDDGVASTAQNAAHSLMPGQAVLDIACKAFPFPVDEPRINQLLHQVFASSHTDLCAHVDLFSRVPVRAVAQLARPVVCHALHRQP